MHYTDAQLLAEINATLDKLASDEQPWIANMVAHAICSDHLSGLGDNDDADFWRHCSYKEVRGRVTACINKRAGDKKDRSEEQLTLPGYNHLHEYYVVERDSIAVGVSVKKMTDEEIDGKTQLYQTMGDSCHAHADELQKFKRERAAEPVVAVA
jgi:hypothetical protein